MLPYSLWCRSYFCLAALNNGSNFKIGVNKNKGSVMGGNSMSKLTGFADRHAAVAYNCFGFLLTGMMGNSQAVIMIFLNIL